MKVGIVIPAYNAHGTINKLIELIEKEGINRRDIVVVDDGSERRYALEGVNLIRLEENRGKGYALRRGYAFLHEMGYTFALSLDADLQHPPDYIKHFIDKAAINRIVIGWRRKRQNMPVERRFTNFLASFFTSLYIKRRVHDAQCGYRLIPIYTMFTRKFWSDGYEFEVEYLCKMKNMEVLEVEIPSVYRGERSYINKIDIVIRYIILVWRLLWHL